MKRTEIKIGQPYLTKVSGEWREVFVLGEGRYDPKRFRVMDRESRKYLDKERSAASFRPCTVKLPATQNKPVQH